MHAELIACIKEARAAAEGGIGRIILETDAQVKGAPGYRLAVLGGLVHELKEVLDHEFIRSSIEPVPRVCNQVVHGLAVLRSSCDVGSDFVMMGAPDCISVVVTSDLAESYV